MKKAGIPNMLNIDVQPNPVNRRAFIYCRIPEDKEAECVIYDLTGAEVSKLFSIQKTDTKVFTWDCKDNKGNCVSPGVYFVRVRSGIEYGGAKLIVMD